MSTLTNLQPVETYSAPGYDPGRSKSQELWILCHEQGFDYAVFDPYQKQLLHANAYEVKDFYGISRETWSGFLNGIDDFLNDYKNVKIVFEHSHYTLIPVGLFEESEAKSYYELKFKLEQEEELISLRIADFSAQLLFTVPKFMMHELMNKFEGARLYHHIQAVLSSLYYQVHHLNKEAVYLNMSGKIFDIIIIKNSQLQLCNTFPYHNPEDVLYFVMHAYQSHNLAPEADDCFFSGANPQSNEVMKLLSTYVKSVKVINPGGFNIEGFPDKNLFLLQHCV
jgi:hypothetical protein